MKNPNDRDNPSVVPEGFHTVTPFLIVKNAQGLLDFITAAFEGRVEYVMKTNDDKISHATVRIGDSTIMIADQMEGTHVMNGMLYLYMEDVDDVYARASKVSGGKGTREPKDEFYGDRSACVTDDWGNQWWIATHIETVDNDELMRRKTAADR